MVKGHQPWDASLLVGGVLLPWNDPMNDKGAFKVRLFNNRVFAWMRLLFEWPRWKEVWLNVRNLGESSVFVCWLLSIAICNAIIIICPYNYAFLLLSSLLYPHPSCPDPEFEDQYAREALDFGLACKTQSPTTWLSLYQFNNPLPLLLHFSRWKSVLIKSFVMSMMVLVFRLCWTLFSASKSTLEYIRDHRSLVPTEDHPITREKLQDSPYWRRSLCRAPCRFRKFD